MNGCIVQKSSGDTGIKKISVKNMCMTAKLLRKMYISWIIPKAFLLVHSLSRSWLVCSQLLYNELKINEAKT